jgi:hypothetical protein
LDIAMTMIVASDSMTPLTDWCVTASSGHSPSTALPDFPAGDPNTASALPPVGSANSASRTGAMAAAARPVARVTARAEMVAPVM